MIHIRSVEVHKYKPWPDMFPFNVPILASLKKITFDSPITFLVGENGSGKSTLLEALACAAGSIVVGSAETNRDETLVPLRELARDLRLVWSKRTRKGFFMRSEDFFGFARRMDRTKAEMQAYLKDIEKEYKDRSEFARQMASMPYNRELGDMQNRYGEGVDARSHGESYLNLFRDRFIPGGLYLLDEPEAPLSPRRQLAFLVLLKQMLDQEAQFIIATHSPILMGYPGAAILSCDDQQLHKVEYNDLEHVIITRDFLAHPRLFQRELGLLDDDQISKK
jgi:predicted ATPase